MATAGAKTPLGPSQRAKPPPDPERPRPRRNPRPSVKLKSSWDRDDHAGARSTPQAVGFDEQIQTAATLIQHHCIYVDTVQVLLRRQLSPEDARRLIKLSPPQKVILERRSWLQFPFRIRLHQPNSDALIYLDKVAADCLVNRIDISLDLVTASWEAADELREFFHRHLTQRWHGKRRRCTVEGTIYFSRAWQRRNIAIYNLREAPHTCHIEIRLYGALTLRRYGIRSLSDAVDLDGSAVIVRNCRLSALIWARVERAIDDIVGNTVLLRHRKSGIKSNRGEIREEYEVILSHCLRESDDCRPPVRLPLAPVQLWIDNCPYLVRTAVIHRPFTALIKIEI